MVNTILRHARQNLAPGQMLTFSLSPFFWKLSVESPFGRGCRLAGRFHPCRARLFSGRPLLLTSAGDTKPTCVKPWGKGDGVSVLRPSHHSSGSWIILTWQLGSGWRCSELLLVLQEGDGRKLPAASPRADVSHSILQLGSDPYRPSVCLSTRILQSRLYNPVCCDRAVTPGEASLPQNDTDPRQKLGMGGKFFACPRGLEGRYRSSDHPAEEDRGSSLWSFPLTLHLQTLFWNTSWEKPRWA